MGTAAASSILCFGGGQFSHYGHAKSDRINPVVTIIFEAHATSADNEKDISSGHANPRLSNLGVKQASTHGLFTSSLSQPTDQFFSFLSVLEFNHFGY